VKVCRPLYKLAPLAQTSSYATGDGSNKLGGWDRVPSRRKPKRFGGGPPMLAAIFPAPKNKAF